MTSTWRCKYDKLNKKTLNIPKE